MVCWICYDNGMMRRIWCRLAICIALAFIRILILKPYLVRSYVQNCIQDCETRLRVLCVWIMGGIMHRIVRALYGHATRILSYSHSKRNKIFILLRWRWTQSNTKPGFPIGFPGPFCLLIVFELSRSNLCPQAYQASAR